MEIRSIVVWGVWGGTNWEMAQENFLGYRNVLYLMQGYSFIKSH